MKDSNLIKALKAMPAKTTSNTTDVILQQMRQYWGGLEVPGKDKLLLDWRQAAACLIYSETAQKTLLTHEENALWFFLLEKAKSKYHELRSRANSTSLKLSNILSESGGF